MEYFGKIVLFYVVKILLQLCFKRDENRITLSTSETPKLSVQLLQEWVEKFDLRSLQTLPALVTDQVRQIVIVVSDARFVQLGESRLHHPQFLPCQDQPLNHDLFVTLYRGKQPTQNPIQPPPLALDIHIVVEVVNEHRLRFVLDSAETA